VAIACFVLPGTEKYFQKWMDLFARTLMVYPIIAVLFAVSNVMAAILLNSAGTGAGTIFGPAIPIFAQSQAVQSDGIATAFLVAAIVVLLLPLGAGPFAFKMAGGAIGAVMNAAGGRATSLSGGMRKRIAQSKEDPFSFLGSRKRERKNRVGDWKANTYNRNVNRGGIRGWTGRQIGGRYSASKQAMLNEESGKIISSTSASGNDAYIRAGTIDMDALRGTSRHRVNANGQEEFMAASGNWFNAGEVRAGKSQLRSVGEMQAAFRLVLQKTENLPPENQQMVLEDFGHYATSAGLSAGEASGHWAGISIPNQRIRQDIRHAGFAQQDGQLVPHADHAGLLGSMGTQQGFTMASQQEGTFEAMTSAYRQQYYEYQQATGDDKAVIGDRLHNARENLRKFVGTRGPGLPQPDEDGTMQAGAAYGGASSASFKTEEAAKKALAEIDHLHNPDLPNAQPEPAHRDYSGGRTGDRQDHPTIPGGDSQPLPNDPNRGTWERPEYNPGTGRWEHPDKNP
jgi:hypothetical protein